MKPLQKLVNEKGIEVLLFPLEYLYMSQDEGGDFSHAGTLSMDFLGWGENGRIKKCPYYAPCTLKCVKQSSDGSWNYWQSEKEVYLADGSTSFITIVTAHDDFPASVGTRVVQGGLLGHTGTKGQATGDHLHLNIAKGLYDYLVPVPPNNNYQLPNSIHIYDACFVNDTVIKKGYNHKWRIFEYIPSTIKPKNKFKWVLYTNKIRTRNFKKSR